MLKKEQEETLAGLERLSAKESTTEKLFGSMLAVVLVIVIVIAIGVHVIPYLVRSWKCEQMPSPKTRTEHTVCDFQGSYGSEDLK
jgi:hypothetical protein